MRGSSSITGNTAGGSGGGVYHIFGGTLDGVRWEEDTDYNVSENTPNNVYIVYID
jgi:hypothetical protein